MSLLEELKLDTWNPVLTAAAQAAAIDTLEAGRILYLPRLAFALLPHEQRFLSPDWSDGETKNINLRGGERRLRGARGGSEDLARMQAMMERFSSRCATLIGALLPHYVPHLTLASTSFSPARSPAARAPTAKMTRACTPMPFPPIRPAARASCACSPTPTRRASRAPGAWESRLRTWRPGSCRARAARGRAKPSCCARCA